MAVNGTTASSIAAVDSTARNLYRRARTSGPDFADIATVVRSLHTVLKHLRVEAEDGDSLLNSTQQESSVYARQLTPIVEDTDFTLRQLEVILEKYGSSDYYDSTDDPERGHDGQYVRSKEMEDRERDMVALIRTKLQNQKINIDIFLDTVQLHNPTTQQQPMVDLEQTDGPQMNTIKDKVDKIAARLLQRRVSGTHSEEEMWQQFRTELVKEGFSSDVLRKHKEVLRAYIRELDSNGLLDNGSPPSVRGLLDQRPQNSAYPLPPPPVAITPASYPSRGEDMSPKEMVSPPHMDNEKFMPDVKLQRRHPDQGPAAANNTNNPYPPPMGSSYNPYIPPDQQQQHHHHHHQQQQHTFLPPPPAGMPLHNSTDLSYEQRYSSDSDSDSQPQQLALISTRDLMALDRRDADALAVRMGGLHVGPAGLLPALPPPNYSVSPGTSPSGRYLPPPPPPLDSQLSSSPQSQALLGASPRYVPPILPPYDASPRSSALGLSPPPPAYNSGPALATSAPVPAGALAGAQRYSRLAPDSKGQDIPMEAKWTRIRRTLVSPVVLDRAGVRYEARPDFVAVLGVLSKEDIAEFARQSAAARASRSRGRARAHSDANSSGPGDKKRPVVAPPHPHPHEEKRGPYDDKAPRSSGVHASSAGRRHSDSGYSDSEDQLWDESGTDDSDDSESAHSRERSSRRDARYVPRQYRQGSDAAATSSSSDSRDHHHHHHHAGGGGGRKGGTRAYPVIVPFPSSPSPGGGGGEKASPASTVQPKPILKNLNKNHVRFDPDGPREVSPGELQSERDRRDRRGAERPRRSEQQPDRQQQHPRRRDDRDKDAARGGDRDRERSSRHGPRDSHHSHRSSGRRDGGGGGGGGNHHHRDRDRGERDASTAEDARDKRRVRKSVWGETLGAVGIGGAAASLLSVLTEAASGL